MGGAPVYQLHISVSEFVGAWRVHFAFSRQEETGQTVPYGTREVWVSPESDDEDPLASALRVVARAVAAELGPKR